MAVTQVDKQAPHAQPATRALPANPAMARVFNRIVKQDFIPMQEPPSVQSAVRKTSIPVGVRQVAQPALPEVTHQVARN